MKSSGRPSACPNFVLFRIFARGVVFTLPPSQIGLIKTEHSSPMPPFVPKTKGVKLPCYTSRTCSLYSLFFAFSCFLKISFVDEFWLDWALTCVTQISKNAVCPYFQNPLALMSNFDSSFVFAVLYLKLVV